MTWKVRPATAADAARLVEIRVLSWQHAYRDILPPESLGSMRTDNEAALAHWAELAVAPAPTGLFVAVGEDDRPVAFCLVGAAREDVDRHPSLRTAELWAIYADPDALGTGAGGVVHDAGVEHLERHGFQHAVLWVLEDNKIGRRFYDARGWRPDGGRTDYEWGGASVMEMRYARPLGQPSSV
ncbi:MAG TPA: GNAT family N-acetyltransferase [Pseudonocardiaceae bacterium]|nr:GNAT family N-acetyltransferase [Pseudonocardiaceae bacterium]